MKPVEQQKHWLKEYLLAVLNYHETYEEVYDHILLALETRPPEKFFESTVESIITDDFGGMNGLLAMETNCRNAVTNEVRNQYRRHFFSFLKLPDVVYTVLISIITGYIAGHLRVKVIFLIAVIWVLVALTIPFVLLAALKFKTRYKSNAALKSGYHFSHLNFFLIYIVVAAITLGYIATNISYDASILSESISILIMIPVLWSAAWKLKVGYKSNGAPKLLKDTILSRLASKPFRFLWWYILLTIPLNNNAQFQLNRQIGFNISGYIFIFILIITFIAVTIHLLSFIKLMRKDFRMSVLR